ncbi:glycosyltransferase family 4 protein [Rubrivivax sp. RP6-9]|uniref:glycosyltransferase family 4 protein n=1 Tax=Rubrivivax sp. RP6-9 TaxID=3415750 RepID=UPI003CC65587
MSRAVRLPLPLPLFINGKYTAQRTTGVQRVAARLVLALDALLVEDPAAAQALGPVTLLCPPQGVPPALRHIRARTVGVVALPLHLWEQAVLPWAARGGRLLSLAGAAPYWARRPAALLHDAAVWDHPEAYTPAFVRWYRLLFARQARVAQPLLTVSAFSQQRLAACLGLPPQRLQVLHNGADHLAAVAPDDTLLRQHGLQPGGFLLAVANANPTKNLEALVRAHAALPARLALPLVIVGGHNPRVFRDGTGAAAPAAAAPVLRVGVQGDAALKALYGAAAALVFPSVYEGFGLPPLEAMGQGCPVLAARAASLPEVCGDAALYCDPADPADMARALVQLLDDPALRQRLRAAGPVQAARYTWSASARGLLAALLPAGQAGDGSRA